MKAIWAFSPGYLCAAFKKQVSNFVDWEGSGGREEESTAGQKGGSCRAKEGVRDVDSWKVIQQFGYLVSRVQENEQTNKLWRV